MHHPSPPGQTPHWYVHHGSLTTGYLTGDRFSPEFIQRRSMELQLFLERVCRHPTLQRAKIVQQFLESSEWHIDMHSYSGQSMGVSAGPHVQALPPPAHHGLLESMGDVFINAFARVRRPDPKFVAVRSELEEQEDRNLQLERVLLRNRTHVSGTYVGPCLACFRFMRKISMTHAGVKWSLTTNCILHIWAHLLKI